ncbi:MAG: ParB/RepB/Spo0J family partition protein [Sulfuricurvum sp.]|uniref:ParB/RepB/Spo0J family partition protein n=1 Tax=Sulfuricurvum sp. TaxID=2025608 RepID=UPI002616A928|nr:ParB/RepB/Spo0J family partition protein [Sulfuricurvum sp.]MDD2830349.1 ParB/RepB/Spo0J family partition protein [Sulfuricurvum sp.]MDD4950688.1 ParB/RepB/Spo0J family partition protein [Sulfuricurvum sp.]
MTRKKIDYSLAKKISQNAALTEQIQAVEKNPDIVIEIPLSKLQPNPYQPRIEIEPTALKELADSIEQNGLLQPIVVSKDNDVLTIIAGHRRFEAHKLLEKEFIKAVVMDKVVHAQLALLPLVENLQRSEMNPIENAIAFKKILEDKIVETQNDLAEAIGVSKSWLSKTLSVLRLPSSLLDQIKKDRYSDITVLSALNKVNSDLLEKLYTEIKTLSRSDALEAIKQALSKPVKTKSRVEISKNKIVINTLGLNGDKKEKVQSLIHQIKELIGE